MDEYGEFGVDLDAEPGVVRKAGFLNHDPTSFFLTSNIVVITEWVNAGLPGCPSVYQIDRRSHVIATNRTDIVDMDTDEQDAEGLLKYTMSDLTQEQFDAYKNPAYAPIIKSLFDPEGYAADLKRATGSVSRRQMRAERKALAREEIEKRGRSPSMARYVARRAIERRYQA